MMAWWVCKAGRAGPPLTSTISLAVSPGPSLGREYPGLHGPGQICYTPAVWPWAGDSPCIVQAIVQGLGNREAAEPVALVSCPLKGRGTLSKEHHAAVRSCRARTISLSVLTCGMGMILESASQGCLEDEINTQ